MNTQITRRQLLQGVAAVAVVAALPVPADDQTELAHASVAARFDPELWSAEVLDAYRKNVELKNVALERLLSTRGRPSALGAA